MPILPASSTPSLDELRDGLAAFREKARVAVRPFDLEARDPRFIARVLPLLGLLYDRYFRCETEIESELPAGRFLAVANHNGMTGIPDMFCHMVAFWRMCSPERLAYGLMHDVPFHVPGAGTWLNASGALAAHPENARKALERIHRDLYNAKVVRRRLANARKYRQCLRSVVWDVYKHSDGPRNGTQDEGYGQKRKSCESDLCLE